MDAPCGRHSKWSVTVCQARKLEAVGYMTCIFELLSMAPLKSEAKMIIQLEKPLLLAGPICFDDHARLICSLRTVGE